MKTLLAALAITASAVAIAGCSTTSSEPATATTSYPAYTGMAAPATAPTTEQRPAWIGSGVFSVGDHATGGAKASIPVGRYTVELQTGRHIGSWYVCSSLPCSPTTGNHTDSGTAGGEGYSMVIELRPTDGAIYGDGVKFVAAG